MFLRAQHFQQQDRWVEMLVRARTAPLRPHGWGMVEMAIDRELLATGRFALSAAAGIFEDGTPFAVPGDADHPLPLDLPAETRNAMVFLALPLRQPGAAEIGAADGGEGRYAPSDFEVQDTHSSSPQAAPLQIGRLRLRYLLEGDDRSGYLCIGVARIGAVAANRRATLDDTWIPPALMSSASEALQGLLTELVGALDRHGDGVASRLTQGQAQTTDLAWLQAINRWQKLLAHWADDGSVHPVDLYGTLVQMAGEFATFSEPTKRPKAYAAYRHDDLQQSFAPVVDDVRRALSVPERGSLSIPLQERRYGVRVGQIADRSVLQAESFVLAVRSSIPTEALQQLFRNQVKIGAVEHIREVVNGVSAGIALRTLPAAPSQVPSSPGAVYFELDRNSAHWQQLQASSGFAIHVAGEFPNLSMELWAVRG